MTVQKEQIEHNNCIYGNRDALLREKERNTEK